MTGHSICRKKIIMANNLAKRIFFVFAIALFLLIGLVAVSAEEVEKERIAELEKEEINDGESQELLKDYYGNLLGYVGTKKFNSIATKDNIAIINVTVNGRDRRILTKLHTATILPAQDLTNAKLIMAENLVVLGNISLKGAFFSEVSDVFGSRRLFGLGSTTLRYVDEGFARLADGKANVSINPILRGLIKGYNVFLSAEGLTRGLYVAEKTDSYFIVNSINPNSNVGFSWMLRGIRKEYEDKLRSQYGREKDIDITATINHENSTTRIRINGLDKILDLVKDTSGNIPINEGIDITINETINNTNNESDSNSNQNNESNTNVQGINLITGNLVDEFGLETDLGTILGNATPLPTLPDEDVDNDEESDEDTNLNDSLIIGNETRGINDTLSNENSSETSPVQEISILEFTLYSVDENLVIGQVSDVTGLSVEQVKKLINFVYLEPEGFEDEDITIEPSLDFIEKVDGSVIIRLG